jgi:hypothetical protein
MKTSSFYTRLFLALLFLCRAHSSTAADADAARILKAIDSICGDSWCEGAFDFRFHQVVLKPQKNEVQIFFRMSQQYPVRLEFTSGQSYQAQINQRFHDVSCLLPGYSTYESIMQSEYVLRWGVYTALTDCINALESRLMQVNQAL